MRQKPSACPLCILILLCILCPLWAGCGSESSGGDGQEPPVFSPLQVLIPEAPGEKILGEAPLTLDISNIRQGYFIAFAQEDGLKKNIQLTAEDGVVYSYFLQSGEEAVIPFTSGSGTYSVICYQEIGGDRYSALYSQTLEVSLENDFLPFLYPNQYVNFSPESQASQLALSMLSDDASDLEGLEAIYEYVTGSISYDYEKAENVEAGYLPDIDETLVSGKGICFDYAALMAAMLRSRDIPCRLQIGYAGDIKHAWIDVYIRDQGWIEKAVFFDGDTWGRMDPTFAANSTDDEQIQSYIGDNTNYAVQFTR